MESKNIFRPDLGTYIIEQLISARFCLFRVTEPAKIQVDGLSQGQRYWQVWLIDLWKSVLEISHQRSNKGCVSKGVYYAVVYIRNKQQGKLSTKSKLRVWILNYMQRIFDFACLWYLIVWRNVSIFISTSVQVEISRTFWFSSHFYFFSLKIFCDEYVGK